MSIKGLLQTVKDTLKKAGHQLAAKEELLLTGIENEFTALKTRFELLEARIQADVRGEVTKVEAKVESEIPLSSTSTASTTTVVPASTSSSSGSSAPISKAQKLALKASVTPNVTA